MNHDSKGGSLWLAVLISFILIEGVCRLLFVIESVVQILYNSRPCFYNLFLDWYYKGYVGGDLLCINPRVPCFTPCFTCLGGVEEAFTRKERICVITK